MVLPACIKNGIRIVSNMGAANPLGGARAARKEAADLGLGDIPVAVVLGDDQLEALRHHAAGSFHDGLGHLGGEDDLGGHGTLLMTRVLGLGWEQHIGGASDGDELARPVADAGLAERD